MQTELGRIAHLLATAEDGPTPLQQRLAALSRRLRLICLVVVIAVALLGWQQGLSGMEVLLSAISEAGESVRARATPEDKLRIVREWKSRGQVRQAASSLSDLKS